IRHWILFFWALSLAVASGCVSVKLDTKTATKARDVKFQEPAAPFQELTNPAADKAWQNKDNGNTISYLSTCNEQSDPALEMVAREMTGDLR
ncbi:MAG: hypothetical protein V4692_02420, partial [Bdellovibrionota bacterium]